jgi:NAD(P)-dependent dehydrogenase (short-subunit alcohol dehydrogenase family)
VDRQRAALAERFAGKVAIVTGGALGIGRAIMEELCKEGPSVSFSGISEIGFTTSRELISQAFDVLFSQGDMADEAFCQQLVDKTVSRYGKVNYLANNASSFTAKGLDATRQDWERSFHVGPIGYATMAQLVTPHLVAQGGGAIVNVSSISAYIAQPNRWTYHAAKGAVHLLTKSMAYDLAQHNIRVNSISPGWIWTREVSKAAELDGGYLGTGPEGIGKNTLLAGSD